MIISILFFIWVLIALVDLIRQLRWQKKIKQQQTRADFRHAEMLEAWEKLDISIEELSDNKNEIKSLKRHIRALLEALEKAGE